MREHRKLDVILCVDLFQTVRSQSVVLRRSHLNTKHLADFEFLSLRDYVLNG